jgi:UDP-2,3-diacylglucosamine hydrolase
MDQGVKVYFFQGNHDVWTYSYFEELGMIKLVQPYSVEIAGKNFCLGHGDGLGPVPFGYRLLRSVFHSKVLQFLFSMLHPWIAFRFGNNWSKSNRLSHNVHYAFKGEDEPLYKFAMEYSSQNKVDYFIFGHYHDDVCIDMPSGAQLHILKDWIQSSPYICFDGETLQKL